MPSIMPHYFPLIIYIWPTVAYCCVNYALMSYLQIENPGAFISNMEHMHEVRKKEKVYTYPIINSNMYIKMKNVHQSPKVAKDKPRTKIPQHAL